MRNPRFTARKHMNILQSKSLTQVSTCQKNSSVGSGCCYNIEGSYTQRSCMIYDERHNPVAEIKRKEDVGGVAFGSEVFRLVVQPEIESTLAMAIVVLLDQMFGSKGALSLIRSWVILRSFFKKILGYTKCIASKSSGTIWHETMNFKMNDLDILADDLVQYIGV